MGFPLGLRLSGLAYRMLCHGIEISGQRIDIHCGGIDHISIHHSNEIAQSEGRFGHKWGTSWDAWGFFGLTKRQNVQVLRVSL